MPGIITIDASAVTDLLSDIARSSKTVANSIEGILTTDVRARLAILRKEAPSQQRSDPRHKVKLKDSFSSITMPQTRTIITSTPNKFNWVTGGVGPPRNPIYPVKAKALYWPGIQGGHPVAAVYNKSGNPPNDFVTRAWTVYENGGAQERNLQREANLIANLILTGAILPPGSE